jgi:hypothetical protein
MLGVALIGLGWPVHAQPTQLHVQVHGRLSRVQLHVQLTITLLSCSVHIGQQCAERGVHGPRRQHRHCVHDRLLCQRRRMHGYVDNTSYKNPISYGLAHAPCARLRLEHARRSPMQQVWHAPMRATARRSPAFPAGTPQTASAQVPYRVLASAARSCTPHGSCMCDNDWLASPAECAAVSSASEVVCSGPTDSQATTCVPGTYLSSGQCPGMLSCACQDPFAVYVSTGDARYVTVETYSSLSK